MRGGGGGDSLRGYKGTAGRDEGKEYRRKGGRREIVRSRRCWSPG